MTMPHCFRWLLVIKKKKKKMDSSLNWNLTVLFHQENTWKGQKNDNKNSNRDDVLVVLRALDINCIFYQYWLMWSCFKRKKYHKWTNFPLLDSSQFAVTLKKRLSQCLFICFLILCIYAKTCVMNEHMVKASGLLLAQEREGKKSKAGSESQSTPDFSALNIVFETVNSHQLVFITSQWWL